MTGGCTAQACAFRDDQAEFAKLNTKVVGALPADPDAVIAEAFGVPTRAGGEITRTVDDQQVKLIRGVTEARWTFIIDKNGTIIYKDTDVKAADDSKKVLQFLNSHAAAQKLD